jgi:hypothetical protein
VKPPVEQLFDMLGKHLFIVQQTCHEFDCLKSGNLCLFGKTAAFAVLVAGFGNDLMVTKFITRQQCRSLSRHTSFSHVMSTPF